MLVFCQSLMLQNCQVRPCMARVLFVKTDTLFWCVGSTETQLKLRLSLDFTLPGATPELLLGSVQFGLAPASSSAEVFILYLFISYLIWIFFFGFVWNIALFQNEQFFTASTETPMVVRGGSNHVALLVEINASPTDGTLKNLQVCFYFNFALCINFTFFSFFANLFSFCVCIFLFSFFYNFFSFCVCIFCFFVTKNNNFQ